MDVVSVVDTWNSDAPTRVNQLDPNQVRIFYSWSGKLLFCVTIEMFEHSRRMQEKSDHTVMIPVVH